MLTSSSIKIIIADYDIMFRQTLVYEISKNKNNSIADCVSNGYDLISGIFSSKSLDLVLLNLFLEGICGIEVIQIIRKKLPKLKVIAYSSLPQIELLNMLRNLNVEAYCAKDRYEISNLVNILNSYNFKNEGIIFNSWDNDLLLDSQLKNIQTKKISPLNSLIIEKIAMGMTNNEIADSMDLSTRTIESHIEKLLLDLGLRSKIDIAIFAYKAGICTLSCKFSHNKSCVKKYVIGKREKDDL